MEYSSLYGFNASATTSSHTTTTDGRPHLTPSRAARTSVDFSPHQSSRVGGYSEGGRRFSESASTSAVASPFPFPYPGPPTPEDEFDCSIFSTLTPALSFSNESFTSTSEAFVDSPPPLAQSTASQWNQRRQSEPDRDYPSFLSYQDHPSSISSNSSMSPAAFSSPAEFEYSPIGAEAPATMQAANALTSPPANYYDAQPESSYKRGSRKRPMTADSGISPSKRLHASSPHNPRRVDHRPPPRRASATNTHTVPDHHLSGFSPRISVPSQHYATPPASISEKLPESLDLLPDTLWFEHRMQRPAPNGGNDNKLACALADSCVDLLGRAVRTLSDDEWCLLNVDDPTTVEARALEGALHHLRDMRRTHGKDKGDMLYRSLQLLLFVQFRDVMAKQILEDSARRGHKLTSTDLMCLPDNDPQV